MSLEKHCNVLRELLEAECDWRVVRKFAQAWRQAMNEFQATAIRQESELGILLWELTTEIAGYCDKHTPIDPAPLIYLTNLAQQPWGEFLPGQLASLRMERESGSVKWGELKREQASRLKAEGFDAIVEVQYAMEMMRAWDQCHTFFVRLWMFHDFGTPPRLAVSVTLTAMQRDILEALELDGTDEFQTAAEIARKAGWEYTSRFRTMIGRLVGEHLQKGSNGIGYRLQKRVT